MKEIEKKIFIHNKPSPLVQKFLLFIFILAGIFPSLSLFPLSVSLNTWTFDVDFVQLIASKLIGLTGLFIIALIIKSYFSFTCLSATKEKIFIGSPGRVNVKSLGHFFYTGQRIEIDLLENVRFRAKKDPFSKAISFNIQILISKEDYNEYQILEHNRDPRKVAERINDLILEQEGQALKLHLSYQLKKSLYGTRSKKLQKK